MKSTRQGLQTALFYYEDTLWQATLTDDPETEAEKNDFAEAHRGERRTQREGLTCRKQYHLPHPEELRDREAERYLRLQLTQLAAEEEQAEADKGLSEERMAEGKRAFTRE
ncbi:hypothetical protein NDU88_001869 [Pleurodeles waltl]|uniref:Uncharacterized protein n=1 Tax=Pleurodeles waltl TaxID=8319 RepID=A0AAV7WM66_PLEWA|nr:hypothetical protein NDU88_001869 [Pleurodeles waltl]